MTTLDTGVTGKTLEHRDDMPDVARYGLRCAGSHCRVSQLRKDLQRLQC
jgi:hypothetical protein